MTIAEMTEAEVAAYIDALNEASHVVHLTPQYRVDRVKTFDPARGDTKKPAGEDVVEAHEYHEVDPVALTVKVVQVPEVRTPYWEFDDTVRVGRPGDCPDCTRGLLGITDDDLGAYLACSRLPLDLEATGIPDRYPHAKRPCHEGCLIACGSRG